MGCSTSAIKLTFSAMSLRAVGLFETRAVSPGKQHLWKRAMEIHKISSPRDTQINIINNNSGNLFSPWFSPWLNPPSCFNQRLSVRTRASCRCYEAPGAPPVRPGLQLLFCFAAPGVQLTSVCDKMAQLCPANQPVGDKFNGKRPKYK